MGDGFSWLYHLSPLTVFSVFPSLACIGLTYIYLLQHRVCWDNPEEKES